MKKVFASIALLAAVVLLSACGTTVPVLPTAELEVQIVTSVPDSQIIKYLEVRDDEGVVFTASNFINRLQHFDLPAGETYTLEARVDIVDYTESGYILLTKEVSTVSESQSVVLDLRQQLNTEVSYDATEMQVRTELETEIRGRDDPASAQLNFVDGTFTGRDLFQIAGISADSVLTEAIQIEIGTDASGRDTVWLSPDTSSEDHFFSRSVFNILFEDSDLCGTGVGTYELHWENDGSHLTQVLTPMKICKG